MDYNPWGHKRVRHDLVTKQQWCIYFHFKPCFPIDFIFLFSFSFCIMLCSLLFVFCESIVFFFYLWLSCFSSMLIPSYICLLLDWLSYRPKHVLEKISTFSYSPPTHFVILKSSFASSCSSFYCSLLLSSLSQNYFGFCLLFFKSVYCPK